MIDVLIFTAGAAAGFWLAIYTWPSVRTWFMGIEQELAWLKARAADIEARLRAALDRG